MFSKYFIQFLCLSLALVEIKAMVRNGEIENAVINETKRPVPNEESSEPHDHRRHPHHHHHHHNKKHHKHHNGPESPEGDVMPPSPPSTHGHLQRANHEMILQLWPMVHTLLNKNFHKTGVVDASDDSKLETQSKTKAYLLSKINTKYTETLIEQNKKTNDSKILTKVLETNGETDAIIDFNSDMDVISDKIFKAKSDEESKPVEENNKLEASKMGFRHHNYQEHKLRRMKRSDEENAKEEKKGKKPGFFEKLGSAITEAAGKVKKAFDEDVVKPVKKFIDTKTAEWKKKQQEQQKKKNGQNGQDDASKETTQQEEAHNEK